MSQQRWLPSCRLLLNDGLPLLHELHSTTDLITSGSRVGCQAVVIAAACPTFSMLCCRASRPVSSRRATWSSSRHGVLQACAASSRRHCTECLLHCRTISGSAWCLAASNSCRALSRITCFLRGKSEEIELGAIAALRRHAEDWGCRARTTPCPAHPSTQTGASSARHRGTCQVMEIRKLLYACRSCTLGVPACGAGHALSPGAKASTRKRTGQGPPSWYSGGLAMLGRHAAAYSSPAISYGRNQTYPMNRSRWSPQQVL